MIGTSSRRRGHWLVRSRVEIHSERTDMQRTHNLNRVENPNPNELEPSLDGVEG